MWCKIKKQFKKLITNNLLKNALASESGQAVIEYTLVLIVSVGVILGGLYQLNDAFRQFADSYFGDYLACLLETGELPTLGGGGGFAGECNQEFQAFSLAGGRPLVGGGVTGGGGGSGETGEFGDSDSDSEGGTSGSFSGGTNSGSTIVQSVPSADLGSSSSQRFRARRSASSSGDEANKAGDQTGSASVTDISGYSTGKAIRIPVRDVASIRSGQRFKEDKEEEEKTKVSAESIAAEQRRGSQLIKVERKLGSQEAPPEIEEMSFGYLFRYLLIAAIVIAIVIFIGGQALQVSKST